MAPRPDPRRSRWLLLGGLAGAFALSALRDPRLLAGAVLVVALLSGRGLPARLRRTARAVLPVALGLSLLSLGWLRLVSGAWPPLAPFAALLLRTAAIGLLTFSVLDRVDLPAALAPFPVASRLLSVTLAQIHALRLLATESLLGLRSRMARKPGAVDVLRGAGGVTAALFSLSARNAREVGEAMRSRGF